MLEKLEELIQEREVIENIITLRRTRHAEQMEELKADYADQISNRTGTLVMTDALVKELDEKFENGIQEEFGKRIETVDLKIEIANKEREVEDQSKLVADKKKEIEKAENEIEHEIIRQYFSKEGLSEQPIDRSHIDALKVELEALESKLGELEKQKDELYAKLEILEPTKKEEKVEEEQTQEEPATEKTTAEKPAQEQPTAEEPAQEQQTAEEPAQEQPTAEEPAQEQPTAEEPVQEQPAVEEPTQEEPKIIVPPVTNPVIDKTNPEASRATSTTQKTAKPVAQNQPTTGKTEPAKTTSAPAQPVAEQPKKEEEKKALEKLDVEINKDGSKIKIHREKSIVPYSTTILGLINTEGLEEITKNKPAGDKYVIREVLRAMEDGKLSREEGKQQVKLYTRILQSENESEIEELKKELKLNIAYDLRGMRQSGLSKEERKELEANAKAVRDLGIGEVEAPLYTKAKWAIQDFTEKNRFGKWLKNTAKNLLPKGKKTEQLEAGKEETKTEEPAKKPGELSADEKKVQQQVAKTVAEIAAGQEQSPAVVDNEMSNAINSQIENAGDR